MKDYNKNWSFIDKLDWAINHNNTSYIFNDKSPDIRLNAYRALGFGFNALKDKTIKEEAVRYMTLFPDRIK